MRQESNEAEIEHRTSTQGGFCPDDAPVQNRARREFLKSVGLGAAGVGGGALLSNAFAARTRVGIPGHQPHDTPAIDRWLGNVRREVAAARAGGRSTERCPSVQALAELIERDGIVRMYVTQMIEQVAS